MSLSEKLFFREDPRLTNDVELELGEILYDAEGLYFMFLKYDMFKGESVVGFTNTLPTHKSSAVNGLMHRMQFL